MNSAQQLNTVTCLDSLQQAAIAECDRYNNKEKNMISVTFKQDDKTVGLLAVIEKQFKTGSRGFFGTGKINIGERRYQAQVQLVEIGSKPKADDQA